MFFSYYVFYVVARETRASDVYFAIFKLPNPSSTLCLLFSSIFDCHSNGCYGQQLFICMSHPSRRGLEGPFWPGSATLKASYLKNLWIIWQTVNRKHLTKECFFTWKDKINKFAISFFRNVRPKLSMEKIKIFLGSPRIKIDIFTHNLPKIVQKCRFLPYFY